MSQPPAAYVPTAAATAPDPGPDPATVPTQAPLPESVPAGYGPTYHLNPAPAPAPAPAPVPAPEPPRPKKRRTGLVLGSAAAVLVLAALAVAGVQLLKDKDPGGGQASGAGGPAASASGGQPSGATPTPTSTPTPGTSAGGTDLVEPTASASKPANGTAPDVNAADLTVMNPVNGLGEFAVGAAKINTKQYGAAFIADLGCNGDAIAEFDLNREWKYLDFTAGSTTVPPTRRAGSASRSTASRPPSPNSSHSASRSPRGWR
ncbi:hypothetical protein WKI68_14905 [Streptomyces sp. MS1.HAVA.3]|uniref:Uncharacterized protein n=1 Tax=Streptomyces caledonius TaxID=3134107 RepID=A0ABU8U3W9_9ACTN